jgi:hypothetical protein
LEFDNIEDIEIVGYNKETVDQFISMNEIDVDKSLVGMPETLRSMFTELTFIGSSYLNPKVIKRFEESMRPKWDFTTDANRFFYETLVEMGKINNWKISEYTVNAYMADNIDRMKKYQTYGGYSWVKFVIKMAEESDSVKNIENYYNLVKNYSLVRQYWRMGLKSQAERVVQWKTFNTMKPRDILQLMSKTVNKVYIDVANTEEMKDLTSCCDDFVIDKLQFPEQGLAFAFPLMTQVFQGIRKGQFMAWGMLSNAGKSRFLMRLISNLAFVQDENVLIISNEMTEEEMRACLITTAINNPDIQKLHGIEMELKQNSLQNGVYKADPEFRGDDGVVNGEVVHIIDPESGEHAETPQEYEKRVEKMSSQFNNVRKVAQWIDKKMSKHILIVETGSEYSDSDLKQIIENTCLTEEINYVFYDTFKSDKDAMGDWAAMKKTATILSEIAKKKNIFIGANIQLTDDAALCQPLELTSNNIANSKQIKHVLDALCLFREIPISDYKQYRYWTSINDNPAEMELQTLDNNKRYYVCKIDKNRAGSKPDLLFSLNLDTNVWTEEGRVSLARNVNGSKKKQEVKQNPDGTQTQTTVSQWDADIDG